MPNKYVPYPMVLNGVLIGMLGLREDQIDYFNIPQPTAEEMALVSYLGTTKEHRRNIHRERLDDATPTTSRTIAKRTNEQRERKKLVNSRGGKPIKIPTELTSTPVSTSTAQNPPPVRASIRQTTIRFPGAASNSEISRWLHLKLVSHKPKSFKTPAGADYPIVPGLAGAATTPAPTP